METTTASQPWGDNSSFHMIDVGEKSVTLRRAIAQGSILLSRDAFVALRDKKNPKGSVLALAEVAGIQAAKKTADLIPLCHPLPLSSVRLHFELHEETNTVTAFCEARATAATGVEMEALAGINGALLTIYDLSKAVNPELTITEMRLNLKEGGKSGVWHHPRAQQQKISEEKITEKIIEKITEKKSEKKSLEGVSAVTLTISDSVSQGKAEDKSGGQLSSGLQTLGCQVKSLPCVGDDLAAIQKAVLEAIETQRPALLITTGGTGMGPRDVTPEALEPLCNKKVEGFGELLRKSGAEHIRTAWLSRSFAGIIQGTLVIALPGSPKAVVEGLETLAPLLSHALFTIRGGHHG